MCFIVLLEGCSIVCCCALSAMLLLRAVLHHSCLACHLQTVHPFCGDLYIVFDRNHLIFPAAYLVCQVGALFIFPTGVRICIAHHILHSMPCLASCCLCIAP